MNDLYDDLLFPEGNFTIRGPVTKLRSARGSIFVGEKSQWDGPETSSVVAEQVCEWIFNLPYTSQFGGVWKRQIGTIRRVLDRTRTDKPWTASYSHCGGKVR